MSDQIHNQQYKDLIGNSSTSETKKGIAGKIKNIYLVFMTGVYLLALLTCFIVDMSLNHGLTWFNIVLVTVLMSFSVTNLPFMFKSARLLKSFGVLLVFLVALFWVISGFLGLPWIFNVALKITVFPAIMVGLMLGILSLKNLSKSAKTTIVAILSLILIIAMNSYVYYILYGILSFRLFG